LEAIVKAIAAFTNAQGGTLLIGVNDDGEILGLERDYSVLGNVDPDKFELHLRNFLNSALGEAFVATKLKVTFPAVNGVEICQVNVSPAQKPLFVEMTDKNGQAAEKFYVRSGNSSQEMTHSEMHTYVSERFSNSR
jgi:predicted HTH transcriptional regulator